VIEDIIPKKNLAIFIIALQTRDEEELRRMISFARSLIKTCENPHFMQLAKGIVDLMDKSIPTLQRFIRTTEGMDD